MSEDKTTEDEDNDVSDYETIDGEMDNEPTEEEEDEELEDAEMAELEKRLEAMRNKKQLSKRSGEILTALKVSKKNELEELNADKAEKIAEREKLDAEIEKIDEKVEAKEAEIETLDDIDEKECDVMGYLNENYSDYVSKYNLPKEEKKTTEWSGGGGRTRTAIDRKVYPEYLEDKMVFRASGYHKTDKKQGKITLEIIFNKKKGMFYNKKTKTEYAFLQDANREWCGLRGYSKLGNAWEDFEAYNLKSGKTRSIQTLHIKNWITEEGATDYTDKKYIFSEPEVKPSRDDDELSEEEIEVIKFKFDGKDYLRDPDGNVYDVETQEELGTWNEKTKKIAFFKTLIAKKK